MFIFCNHWILKYAVLLQRRLAFDVKNCPAYKDRSQTIVYCTVPEGWEDKVMQSITSALLVDILFS